jgi:hypothetical protein
LYVTFEEGTWAAWLHDLLQPHVTRVLACDPRKNALLKAGNKNDRIDARKLSELLYLNKLNPVYHGEPGIRTLKELARSYNCRYLQFDWMILLLFCAKRYHRCDWYSRTLLALEPR